MIEQLYEVAKLRCQLTTFEKYFENASNCGFHQKVSHSSTRTLTQVNFRKTRVFSASAFDITYSTIMAYISQTSHHHIAAAPLESLCRLVLCALYTNAFDTTPSIRETVLAYDMTAPTSSSGRLLLPGQPVSVSRSSKPQLELGLGTYARGDYILSSLVGYESRTLSGSSSSSSSTLPNQTTKSKTGLAQTEIVSISGVENRFVVPRPDSTVIARVTRVTPRQAYLSILIVDGQPCGSSSSTSSTFVQSGLGNHAAGEGEGVDFQGVVRSQDVRSTEKDKVKIADCFRPGDIVRATVISLGDARSYYLSTAGNSLGVIYATSATSAGAQLSDTPGGAGWNITGNPMLPISWNQMIDPITGILENRKCAKPDSI